MKIRAEQFSPILGDITKNLACHTAKINQAIADKIDLIIFPELSLSGYNLKDIVYDIALKPGVRADVPGDETFRHLSELSRNIDIVVGAPVEEIPGIIYNCALYFSQGKLLHNHRKTQLPNFGIFEEAMIFKAGDTFRSFKLDRFGFNVGILICREILFPSYAYLYYLQHTDFLIAISNSPHRGLNKSGMGSLKLWERMGEVIAVHFHQNYVFVNRGGYEEGIGFGGGSFFAEPGKGIVTMAQYYDDDSFDCEISLNTVRRSRMGGNYLRDEKPEMVLKELKRILNA